MKTKTLDGVDMDQLIAEASAMADSADAGELPDWRDDPIGDSDEANRQLWALHYRLDELDELSAAFDEDIAKLQAARDDMTAGMRRQVQYLEQRLQAWHRYVLANDKTRKTIKLPAGKLSSTAGRWTVGELSDELGDRLGDRLEELKIQEVATAQPKWKVNRAKLLQLIDVDDSDPSRPFVLLSNGKVRDRDTGEVFEVAITKGERSHRVQPLK